MVGVKVRIFDSILQEVLRHGYYDTIRRRYALRPLSPGKFVVEVYDIRIVGSASNAAPIGSCTYVYAGGRVFRDGL